MSSNLPFTDVFTDVFDAWTAWKSAVATGTARRGGPHIIPKGFPYAPHADEIYLACVRYRHDPMRVVHYIVARFAVHPADAMYLARALRAGGR